MSNVTHILEAIDSGDAQAAAQLLPLVYDELRKLAAAHMAREKPGQTLDATGLVHEAYLRLVASQKRERLEEGATPQAAWDGRRHFFAAAAEAMRRILIENARRKARVKRGGDLQRVELNDVAAPADDFDLLALDDALRRLTEEDPIAAKVVELRYFAGLGHEAIAQTLDITVYLARQKWTYARAWLRDAIPDEH